MTSRASLEIAFTGYWLAGTGAARGHEADAIADRDADGFPVMRMSQIKGQLRETASRLAASGAGGWTEKKVNQYFGTDDCEAAITFDGDATLAAESRDFMRDWPEDIDKLYRSVSGTKIDANGVAEEHTLRMIEGVVPVTLFGVVEWKDDTPDADWIGTLDLVCAATLAFGKLKADGFGRAVARLEPLP
jgi:RAMP superfamily